MTAGERKRKAKELAGLIEALDIAELLRNRLAIMCLEAENPQGYQLQYLAAKETFQLINTIAMEGPLKYAGTGDKLREPAE